MKDLSFNYKERTKFFKRIAPSIAREMSKALQNLTGEKTKVEFSSVQTFDGGGVSVDVQEKCFGSYVNFRGSRDTLRGIAVAIFPLSSTKTLVKLLLKRYFKQVDKETIDHKMKLSAFKEAVNILILTYVTGLANALEIKLKTGVSEFACFPNVEFVKSSLSKNRAKSDALVSVGQFSIAGEGVVPDSSGSSIKGRFIIAF